MKTNTIPIIIVITGVVVGLLIFGYMAGGGTTASVQGAEESNVSGGSLTASEVLYDFGTISMKNGEVTKEFKILNSSDKDIVVKKIETSCMCTRALFVLPDGRTKGPFGMASMGALTRINEIIKSDESRLIRVVYDPNAHGPAGVGQIDRFITVTDDSGDKVIFEIKALVTP